MCGCLAVELYIAARWVSGLLQVRYLHTYLVKILPKVKTFKVRETGLNGSIAA